MANIKHPLFSFRAKGTFSDTVCFSESRSGNSLFQKATINSFRKKTSGPLLDKRKSALHASQSLWRTLSHSEKSTWEHHAASYKRYGPHKAFIPELSNYHKFLQYNMKNYLSNKPLARVSPHTQF